MRHSTKTPSIAFLNARQLMISVILTVALLRDALSISAVRFGEDIASNDISFVYSADAQQYALLFQSSFQYLHLPFAFCFRLRPLAADSACSLTNQTGPYDCLARDPASLNYSKWTLSADLAVTSNKQQFFPNSAQTIGKTPLLKLSVSGTVGVEKAAFSFVGKAQSVFEVLCGDSMTLGGEGVMRKRAFVSTFAQLAGSSSDNLLMPTQIVCAAHADIVSLAFLGMRLREDRPIYMAAFLAYRPSQQPFLTWTALSFSKNKVNRDMMAVYPATGDVEDLFSLYKTAPFLDTSPNVNASNDWTVIASSAQPNGAPSWFYYTQAYRQMDTGDTVGDEVLTEKIGNKYCLAGYFQNATEGAEQQLAATDKAQLHQMLTCFEPDLTLAAAALLPCLLILLLLF